MEESILVTIKKLLGVDKSDTSFDLDILVCINTAILALTQNGVGPEDGFTVEDDTASWSDFLGDNAAELEAAKAYIGMKARLMFDPPSSSVVMEAYNKVIAESEWRLNIACD